VAARPHRRAVGVHRTQRLAGVLDDRQAECLERGHVGRIAEDVHRQQRRGPLGHRRRGGGGIEVERHRVDVDEHRPGALVEDHVRRGHERERRRDHLVAIADADRADRQVEPGGPAGDGTGMRYAQAGGKRLLELAQPRAERQAARTQRLEHPRLLGLAQLGAGEGDRVVSHPSSVVGGAGPDD
jgi:hypothetical protein